VKVMLQKTRRAESLAALKPIGQKVYALRWNGRQKAAFWAEWNARKRAILQRTERRVTRVRKALEKIRSTTKGFGAMSQRIYTLSKSHPDFYPEEGWALIWAAVKARKAAQAA
jgi:hypothetical protein